MSNVKGVKLKQGFCVLIVKKDKIIINIKNKNLWYIFMSRFNIYRIIILQNNLNP